MTETLGDYVNYVTVPQGAVSINSTAPNYGMTIWDLTQDTIFGFSINTSLGSDLVPLDILPIRGNDDNFTGFDSSIEVLESVVREWIENGKYSLLKKITNFCF